MLYVQAVRQRELRKWQATAAVTSVRQEDSALAADSDRHQLLPNNFEYKHV